MTTSTKNLDLTKFTCEFMCKTCRLPLKTKEEKTLHMEKRHYRFWGGRAKVTTETEKGIKKGSKKRGVEKKRGKGPKIKNKKNKKA